MVRRGSQLILARRDRKHLRKRAQGLANGASETRIRYGDVRVPGRLGVDVRVQQRPERQVTRVHLIHVAQPRDLVGSSGAYVSEFEHSAARQLALYVEPPVL